MELTARNQLPATVKSVKFGEVMAEVVVNLVGGQEIVSVITAESVRRLGLKAGGPVIVVVKSTEVLLATK